MELPKLGLSTPCPGNRSPVGRPEPNPTQSNPDTAAISAAALAGPITPSPAPVGFHVTDAARGAIAPDSATTLNALHDQLKGEGIHLIAVRHGQSEVNAAGKAAGVTILSGQTNTPLTDLGRAQAAEAAQQVYQQLGGDTWLIHGAVDPSQLPVVFTSPLDRAHDTADATVNLITQHAQALAQAGTITAEQARTISADVQPHVDPRLIEMGYGAAELQSRDAVAKYHPGFVQNWDRANDGVDFVDRMPGGGESRADVMNRVGGFLHDLGEHDAGKTVLLFAHAQTISSAEADLGELPDELAGLREPQSGVKNATPQTLL